MPRRRPIEPPISYWNYRIRQRKATVLGIQEDVFDVIEIYYDDRNAILFWGEPQITEGQTLDMLQAELGHQIAATTKPVIQHEDLPGT